MPQHFTSLEDALHSLFGSGIQIEKAGRIAGGDINDAYRLALSDGTHIFMKANTKENASFFTAEAAGLSAIAQTGAIGTPKVLCSGTDAGGEGSFFQRIGSGTGFGMRVGTGVGKDKGHAFLLLEFIGNSRRIPNYWEIFAQELAAMHQAQTAGLVPGGTYGFAKDNYIGAGHQDNMVHNSWISFFRECRLEPQVRRAAGYFGQAGLKKIMRLLDRVDRILVEPEHPSLLHGDLWSGNAITGNDGKAWLIDPAAYVGHAEADLAMTELFGGFPREFYAAYEKAAPLQPGYGGRRDLYNLYHLLNHLNLFGRTYLGAVQGIVEGYGAVS